MSTDLTGTKLKAEQVLKDNFIKEPPIDVWELVTNYGLSVSERDFGDKYKNISGFINIDKYLIVLNRSDTLARKAFTIAHEFGHWLLHKNKLKESPDKYAILYRIPLGEADRDPIEAEANCFAANLLVPQKLFDQNIESSDNDLARLFKVSESLIRYRRLNIESGGV